jgi:hypothetical protein
VLRDLKRSKKKLLRYYGTTRRGTEQQERLERMKKDGGRRGKEGRYTY